MSGLRFKRVTHILFDLDGLLINSEQLYEAADKAMLKELGKHGLYSRQLELDMQGKQPLECAKMMIEHYQLDNMTAQQYMDRIQVHHKRLFNKARPMPGISKLLHHLYKHNISCGVATSSCSTSVGYKTSHLAGMMGNFTHVVAGGDDARVKNGKPHPDVFMVALQGFKEVVEPEQVLVFEDAVAGIKAGQAASMQTIFIPDPKLPQAMVDSVQPTLRLSNAHEFQPTLFGLPPYEYAPVTHVIFDVDGLLLDTSLQFTTATKQVLAKHGKSLTWDQRVSLMGRRRDDIIETMIEMLDLPLTTEELAEEYSKRVDHLLPEAELFDGATRLINHLHSHGIPIAVATSSSTESMESKTSNHRDVFDKFNHIVTGSDIENGKPAPDIFQVCCRLFPDKPQPSKCLVFEDAPNGVEAADAAGMQTVMIPHYKVTPDLTLQATQVLSSLVDFRPEDFGLPPFQDRVNFGH